MCVGIDEQNNIAIRLLGLQCFSAKYNNMRSQQYLPVQLSRVKMPSNCAGETKTFIIICS